MPGIPGHGGAFRIFYGIKILFIDNKVNKTCIVCIISKCAW